MPVNYTKKELYQMTFTPTGATEPIIYVFKSNALSGANITANDLTALGIVKITAVPADSTGYCKSPNSPKPPRYRKDGSTGSKTTFCNPSAIPTATAAGWYFAKRGKQRGVIVPGSGKKRVTVYVTVGGINYAWNMDSQLYTNISSDLANLGIKVPTTAAEKASLVWGASSPIPARVAKTSIIAGANGAADEINTYTTFCSEAKEDSLPAGWGVVVPRLPFSL